MLSTKNGDDEKVRVQEEIQKDLRKEVRIYKDQMKISILKDEEKAKVDQLEIKKSDNLKKKS